MSKKRLGKGLDALLSKSQGEKREHEIKEIDINKIKPNPYQPRNNFSKDTLKELALSIEKKGVLQPITVREVQYDKFELVTGERRWKAAKQANLKTIPAIIREFKDNEMMEVALIENLQREDLNPIEEAHAYKKMIQELDITQEEVAERVSKSRSTISNTIRLLNLPPSVQDIVSRETLSMGHARALLPLETKKQIKLAKKIEKEGLSVRETEKKVKAELARQNSGTQKKRKNEKQLEPKWVKAREQLAESLGLDVDIKERIGKKIVSIKCKDYNEMKKILEKLDLL
ncbi:MAG: ParB/RepB/Spo0J family partition protein [Halanaerobiales bacterium]|nr:ParB/RepB/Spo0J family partition protein [Halanaerobiales bacterium]